MKKLLIVFIAAASVFLYSCETDVDIIGDYKETTIVYGLLNQDSNTFVKVNKAFLGRGNALTMAKIEDSSSYHNITVQMEEWKEDQLLRTIDLSDTIIDNKEEGIFYNPYQKLYYTGAELNENYRYELRISFPDGREDVTASAELVHNFGISRPPNISTIIFMNEPEFRSSVRWDHAVNALYYEVSIRFNYKEKRNGQQDTIYRHMDWDLGSVQAENGGMMELSYNSSTFYSLCAERIPYEDAAMEQQVVSRFSNGVEFILSVASEDFYTYLEVNSASNSIIQDKPQYTNIENGLGLFASRYVKVMDKKLHMDTQFNLEAMNLKFKAE